MSTTSFLPEAAYKAMAVQAKRLHRDLAPAETIADLRVQLAEAQRDLAAANLEIQRLNAENDKLALKAHRSPKVNAADSGTFINGREVVNQVEAAKRLKVKQYQVSRWLKAGKFEKTDVAGHKKPMIYADTLHKPEHGQPGRKKK